MNSLQELNDFSNTSLRFGDERAEILVFDTPDAGPNTNIDIATLPEGDDFYMQTYFDITQAQSLDPTITLQCNVKNISDATVSWYSPLPTGLTASNPSTGIFQLSGIAGVGEWDLVKSPRIVVPRDFSTNTFITMSLTSSEGTRIWKNTVTFVPHDELDKSSLSQISFTEDSIVNINDYPQITDIEADGTYRMVITPSSSLAIHSWDWDAYEGVSTTVNPVGRAITIQGNRAGVNLTMQTLTFYPYIDFDQNFTLNWSLTNPDGFNTQVNQWANCTVTNDEISANIADARTYTENQSGRLFGNTTHPVIQEYDYGQQYTVSMQLQSNIGYIAQTPSDSNWDAGTRTYSLTTTAFGWNNIFGNLNFYPWNWTFDNSTITYTQTRTQNLQGGEGFEQTANQVSTSFSLNGSPTTYNPQLDAGFYTTDSNTYAIHELGTTVQGTDASYSNILTVYGNTTVYLQAQTYLDSPGIEGGDTANVQLWARNPSNHLSNQIYSQNIEPQIQGSYSSPNWYADNIETITDSISWDNETEFDYTAIRIQNRYIDAGQAVPFYANRREEAVLLYANIARSNVDVGLTQTVARARYVQDKIDFANGTPHDFTSRGTSYLGWTDSDGIQEYGTTMNDQGDGYSLGLSTARYTPVIDHNQAFPFYHKVILPYRYGMLQTGANTAIYTGNLIYKEWPETISDFGRTAWTQNWSNVDVTSTNLWNVLANASPKVQHGLTNTSNTGDIPPFESNQTGWLWDGHDYKWSPGGDPTWVGGSGGTYASGGTEAHLHGYASHSDSIVPNTGWQDQDTQYNMYWWFRGEVPNIGMTNLKLFVKYRMWYWKDVGGVPTWTYDYTPTILYNLGF